MLPSAQSAVRASGTDTDVEHDGTGNPGAMNTSHLIGKRWGAAVFAADVAKGWGAAVLGRRLLGATGANAAAAAAVVGHCYPATRGFRGGKGVATSIGQVLGTFPAYFPIDAGVALATAAVPALRHRTFTANTVASLTWVGCAIAWWRNQWPNPGGPAPTAALPAAAAVSSVAIFARFLAERDKVVSYEADGMGEG
ncbi:MAG: glycerol-3-phosphate acyltransferase [Acidimicrobiales bacterium]|nr:glycerol-3-phosphate acyltransferase [Acidimicrobiales bacterium]